jgi:hypothetical protein
VRGQQQQSSRPSRRVFDSVFSDYLDVNNAGVRVVQVLTRKPTDRPDARFFTFGAASCRPCISACQPCPINPPNPVVYLRLTAVELATAFRMVPGASESHELTARARSTRPFPLQAADRRRRRQLHPELTKANPEHFGICIATAGAPSSRPATATARHSPSSPFPSRSYMV